MTKKSATNKSFAGQLAWAILAIAFGLTTVLLVADLVVSRKHEERMSKREATNILALTSASIAPMFDKADIVLQNTLVRYGSVLKGQDKVSPLDANQELLAMMSNLSEAQEESLRLIDAEGKVIFVASKREVVEDISVADKSYFMAHKRVANAGLVISDPIFSKLTGKWMIALSRGLWDSNGEFKGVAQIFLGIKYISEVMERVEVGERSSISLVAMDGGVIARSPELESARESEYDLTGVFDLLSKNVSQDFLPARSLVEGDIHRISFKKMPGIPLILVVGISKEDYLNNWRKKATLYGISWIFVAFMMGGLWHITEESKNDQKVRKKAVLELERVSAAMKYKDQLHEAMVKCVENECENNREVDEGGIGIRGLMAKFDYLLAIADGKVNAHPGEMFFEKTMQPLIVNLEGQARRKGLEFFVDHGTEQNKSIVLDGNVMGDILIGLLSDAVENTKSGRVTLVSGFTEHSDEGALLQIEVLGTRVDLSGTRLESVKGFLSGRDESVPDLTSIDIAIACAKVGILGGKIRIENAGQKGAGFEVLIPIKWGK